MVTILQGVDRGPSKGERLREGISKGVDALSQYLQEKQTRERESAALLKLGIGPEAQDLPKEAKSAYFAEQFSRKAEKEAEDRARKLREQEEQIAALEESRGYEPGSLKGFTSNPSLAERVTRPAKKTQASQPIEPEQLAKIEQVTSMPGFEDLDEVQQHLALVKAGVSKENAEPIAKLTSSKKEREQKGIESSYKSQEDFINDVTDRYKAFETDMKPRLLQMQNIPPEDLVSPTASVFLDSLGIPLGALKNPSSELYDKLSHDLLKGLPETYGNKILKVEVDNFLKTIPTLMNSVEGRRMIASNMLKLGEMKEVYYNEMRKQQKEALDSNKPLPKDFQQRVFDQVKPQINKINNEFAKMSEVTAIPDKHVAFFGEDGEIHFVPNTKEDIEWCINNGGKRIW